MTLSMNIIPLDATETLYLLISYRAAVGILASKWHVM